MFANVTTADRHFDLSLASPKQHNDSVVRSTTQSSRCTTTSNLKHPAYVTVVQLPHLSWSCDTLSETSVTATEPELVVEPKVDNAPTSITARVDAAKAALPSPIVRNAVVLPAVDSCDTRGPYGDAEENPSIIFLQQISGWTRKLTRRFNRRH